MIANTAAIPITSIGEFAVQVWQTDDGLPQTSASSVVQDRDGYLWIATYGGLARFDGVRFTVFDDNNTPEMSSRHITSLFVDQEGAVWCGNDNGQITSYRDGRFQALALKGDWSGHKIVGIGADRKGDLWFLCNTGELVRVKDGFSLKPASGASPRLVVFVNNEQGDIWIQRDNEVLLLEHNVLTPLPLAGANPFTYIQGIGASRDGGLWIIRDQRVKKWSSNGQEQDVMPTPWEGAVVHCLIETKDGHLAAGTSVSGLFLFKTNETAVSFSRTNGFPSDWIISLFQDREGNVWAGSGNGGLAKLRAGNVTTVTPPDRWQGRALLSVLVDRKNALWIGTEGAGLYRYFQGAWTNYAGSAGIENPYLWSLLEATDGSIWAGMWGGGLVAQQGGVFQAVPGISDWNAPVTALLNSSSGEGIWVGTGLGLLKYEAGKIEWYAKKPEIVSPQVVAVKEGRHGEVWFGMSGGGLGCWQQGKLRQFRRADGLSSELVQSLHLDSEGTLWIGTGGGGISRLKHGRFSSVTTRHGLSSDIICAIEEDEAGYFWISSHGGIMRVSRAEMNRCADRQTERIQPLTYGLSDGLPTLECSGGFQPAVCRTADGRIWFPTIKGLVAVNPANVTTNLLPPPVIIERVLVDDVITPWGKGTIDPVRLSPGRHRLEIQFTGLSFAAPEKVKFKCRLEGLNSEWIDSGTRRSAHYSYIPPGDYTFQVIACNNDGVWNQRGASLSLKVMPYFWQTLWFRTLAGATLVGFGGLLVWWDSRRRTRRKFEQLERQKALEQERSRIAKDIHDDLGASLTRISMLSQSARGDVGNPPATDACLRQIYSTTGELTNAMAEIVWAVNPQHDTLDSLASYIQKFAHDFLKAANIRCRLDMPLDPPLWHLRAEVRHNVFLAFKEAVNNAVKHAGASEIRISLKVERAAFVLGVEDNGHGFEPGTKEPGGSPGTHSFSSGLSNFQRRLHEIGGTCEISSAPGKGTKVQFFVPIATTEF
ncbi:MAG: ATP-binding protein [Akkermansiaceae bacterium]|nr:ATP-binding protein [Verrucomicrobiales bacterium]